MRFRTDDEKMAHFRAAGPTTAGEGGVTVTALTGTEPSLPEPLGGLAGPPAPPSVGYWVLAQA